MTDYKKSILECNPIIRSDLEKIAKSNLPWEELHDKKVLVTGGGGFLASYLIKSLHTIGQLHKLNIKVVCVARAKQSVETRLAAYLESSDIEMVLHDISQPLPTIFPSADFIIHCASQASPKFYGVDPVGTLRANSLGTLSLLEHALKTEKSKLMFFSSSEVYGEPLDSNKLVSEVDFGYLDPMNVRSCYAESKRMGENMCVAWAHQNKMHVNVVRPFHIYGPGVSLDDGRVFADFVADVVAKRDIILKSDGLAMRPFCYIADATVAFLTVLLRGEQTTAYNVGNPYAEISILKLATLLANLFPERNIGVRFEIPISSNAYLKSPVYRACPSIEKIRNLGWAPFTGVQEGFHRTITSFI